METLLRQFLIMSQGDFLVFWQSTVSGTIMTLFLIVTPVARALVSIVKRDQNNASKVSYYIAPVLVVFAIISFSSNLSAAEAYPTKPVTVVVPYPPGGRTDLCARAVVQYLSQVLGKPFVVVNKPGASGVLGAKEVAESSADGYTLGFFSTGFLTAQYTVPTPTSVADYDLVSLINLDPAVIAVSTAGKFKSIDDVIAYARSNPKRLRVGIDAGSSAQIFAAAFVQKANIDVSYVPFRGGGERTVALAGNHIDVDFDIMSPLKTMRDARKIAVLGVAATDRWSQYPETPTMKEGGIDLEISSWHGIFAPKGTPTKIIAILDQAIGRVAKNAEFQSRMNDLLLGVKYLNTASFEEFFKANDRTLELIEKLGLRVSH
jgi:tripartite-type tricarboxylate transporter receptor subunit TctC